MNITETLNGLKEKQQTISDLIDLGLVLVKKNGKRKLHFEKQIDVDTVFNTPAVSITIATFHDEGIKYPYHCHEGIVEYLIVLKGSFGIILPHNGYRIITEKECAHIPANIMHSCVSLTPNAQLMGICLPAEPAYINDCKGVKDVRNY